MSKSIKLYTVTDHDSHWPVDVASIVLSRNRAHARYLLDKALIADGLKPHAEKPYNLAEVKMDSTKAVILVNGD